MVGIWVASLVRAVEWIADSVGVKLKPQPPKRPPYVLTKSLTMVTHFRRAERRWIEDTEKTTEVWKFVLMVVRGF